MIQLDKLMDSSISMSYQKLVYNWSKIGAIKINLRLFTYTSILMTSVASFLTLMKDVIDLCWLLYWKHLRVMLTKTGGQEWCSILLTSTKDTDRRI